jgi:hypothetical protein
VNVLVMPAPDDFPLDAYLKVAYEFESWPDIDRRVLEQLRASWNAVAFRYLGAARWDDEFRDSIATAGVAPRGAQLLEQDSALFGFFAAAIAVIHSLVYASNAAACLIEPDWFREVADPGKQWKIAPKKTADQLACIFPDLSLGPTLHTLITSEEFGRINDIRNVLVHRSVPLRDLAIDTQAHVVLGAALQFEIHGKEAVTIEPALTADARGWLAANLETVAYAMIDFIRSGKASSRGTAPWPFAKDGYCTQRVTAVDIANGRVRLPRDAKRLFPDAPGKVVIDLRGERLEVAYDPRVGPDRERSATLSIPRATLRRLVADDEVLVLRSLRGGAVEIR